MGLDTDFGVTPQPPPIYTDRSKSVTDEVILDLVALIDVDPFYKSHVESVIKDVRRRRESGIKKYGTELKTFNGRDALVDAYQELLDFASYFRQILTENEEITNGAPSSHFFMSMYSSSLRWLRDIREVLSIRS